MSNRSFTPERSRDGTVIPNRIFVGGISASTTEADLNSLFQQYGRIRATKIIVDRSGIAKGYGFVTYETEEEAQKALKQAEELTLKDRKLNVATAIKKTNLSSVLGDSSQIQGLPVFAGRENLFQAGYPVVVHQPLYLQQYHYPTPTAATGFQAQYIYAPLDASDLYYYNSQTMSPQSQPATDYAESSSDAASEGGKSFTKHCSAKTPCSTSEYEIRTLRETAIPAPSPPILKYPGSVVPGGSPLHPPQYQLGHVMPSKPGIALFAYPNSVMMGSPTLFHVKESTGGDPEGMSDFNYLHSPMQAQIGSGALTPPPTPLVSMPCDFGSNSSLENVRKN